MILLLPLNQSYNSDSLFNNSRLRSFCSNSPSTIWVDVVAGESVGEGKGVVERKGKGVGEDKSVGEGKGVVERKGKSVGEIVDVDVRVGESEWRCVKISFNTHTNNYTHTYTRTHSNIGRAYL